MSSKVRALEELAKEQAALRARRRALLLQLELASGLARCEGTLARDTADVANARESAEQADAPRMAAARELERVAEQLHRLSIVAELVGHAEVGADVLDRIATARRAAGERALSASVSAAGGSHGPALAHCLRAVEALDVGAELVVHVRERLVRPRAAQLVRDMAGLPTVPSVLRALAALVTDELGVLTPAVAVRGAGGGGGALARALAPFRLVANAVWPELIAQLIAGRPGLFAPGVPAAFHTHYTTAVQFGAQLEALCADEAELAELRAHAASTDFARRWNLSLYFQLRLNETVEQVEHELARGGERAPPPGDTTPSLQLRASAAIARALLVCTSPDVVLRPLAHRFLRLVLQLLARFSSWAQAALAAPDARAPAAADARAAGAAGDTASAGDAARPPPPADVVALGAALLADSAALGTWVRADFESRLLDALGLRAPDAEPHAAGARECLAEGVAQLERTLAAAHTAVCTELELQCVTRLSAVRTIAAAYRFQAKGLPTHPSAFMPDALEPVVSFAREQGSSAPSALKQVCARSRAPRAPPPAPTRAASRPHARGVHATLALQAVLEDALAAVAARYAQLVAELVQTTHRTESSIKRLQPRRQPGAGAEGGDGAGGPSDSAKIFAQLRIDAGCFREQVTLLLVESSWPSPLSDALHRLDLATVVDSAQ